jgi:hypothetical protein
VDENLVKEFIEHHGVIGMKWGTRRGGVSKGRASPESRRVSALKNRPRHTLTNKQLKTVNERMNLEQNFSKMNPTTRQKGKAHAAEILSTVAIGVTAYNVVTSNAGKAAIAAGKKFLRIKSKGQMKLF